MKEIFIYLEGKSDKAGLYELLFNQLETAKQIGNAVNLCELNGKRELLKIAPVRALNILRNKPNSYVFIIPDLYPPDIYFAHKTYSELKDELETRFSLELKDKNCDKDLIDRYFVHCFKYDFESLILASEESLLKRLKKSKFTQTWNKPVENQDHDKPPKRIVEALYKDAGMKYKDTEEARWILSKVNYKDLIEKCPQQFKPFVEDLFKILELDLT